MKIVQMKKSFLYVAIYPLMCKLPRLTVRRILAFFNTRPSPLVRNSYAFQLPPLNSKYAFNLPPPFIVKYDNSVGTELMFYLPT